MRPFSGTKKEYVVPSGDHAGSLAVENSAARWVTFTFERSSLGSSTSCIAETAPASTPATATVTSIHGFRRPAARSGSRIVVASIVFSRAVVAES
jgi:hypothetical protein